MSFEDVEEFVYRWNINNPIDRWWREKHGISFNSPEHRVFSFIDMCIEFVEDFLYHDIRQKIDMKKGFYIPGSGNWLKSMKKEVMSQEMIDEMFDSVKLEDYDDK